MLYFCTWLQIQNTHPMTDPVFLMTMHNDVQAIYENGLLTIYGFGDGDNTSSSDDPEIVFEEEYCGSWGWSRTVGTRHGDKVRVETMTDRSNTIMGDSSSTNETTDYDDIHEFIKKRNMDMSEPLTVIQCKASNLNDCFSEFHKYFDALHNQEVCM